MIAAVKNEAHNSEKAGGSEEGQDSSVRLSCFPLTAEKRDIDTNILVPHMVIIQYLPSPSEKLETI